MTSNNKSKTAGERGKVVDRVAEIPSKEGASERRLADSCINKSKTREIKSVPTPPATSGYQMDIEMNKFKELRELEKGLKEVEILMDIPNLRDGFEVTTTYYMLKKALAQKYEEGVMAGMDCKTVRLEECLEQAKQEERKKVIEEIKKHFLNIPCYRIDKLNTLRGIIKELDRLKEKQE